jgi:hypothetical protein
MHRASPRPTPHGIDQRPVSSLTARVKERERLRVRDHRESPGTQHSGSHEHFRNAGRPVSLAANAQTGRLALLRPTRNWMPSN